MGIDWIKIERDEKHRINKIREKTGFYDYSDEEHSLITDAKLIEYLDSVLRKSKKLLFDITDISFEKNIKFTKDFDNLRVELDIFLDELKIRHCEWKNIGEGLIKEIIKADLELIIESENLNKKLEHLAKEMLDFKQIKIKGHAVVYQPEFWKEVEKEYEEINRMIKSMARVFMKRELICNVKNKRIREVMEKIEKTLKEKI